MTEHRARPYTIDLSGAADMPRRRRDRTGYRRMFERYNAVREPDGSLALYPVPWWVRRWRAIRRWIRP